MRKLLRVYFIPHRENHYLPHLLHTRSILWYGGVSVLAKCVVILFVLVLPMQAFLLTDTLSAQERKIIAFTNQLREEVGLQKLIVENKLRHSAESKARDMASGGYFSHRSPSGKTVSSWIDEAGYPYRVAGENLAL